MTASTETLIQQLAGDAAPVRRMRPPMLRATLWLLAAGAVATVAVLICADLSAFAVRASRASVRLELGGTLATGVLAVIAAFHLSLPDRSPWWAALPLPALPVWFLGSGMGCYRDWLAHQGGMWRVGESADCLLIIVGCAIPLSAALLWALRRARPLAPVPVAAMAGLGAAAFGAFLLVFFHSIPATFMDLLLHAAGVGGVILACSLGGQRAVAG